MKSLGSLDLNSWQRRTCILLSACALLWPATSFAQRYVQTDLVSDIEGRAKNTDPHLVNPWGLARSTNGPWWVANNGTGTSTLYNRNGDIQTLVVTIPGSPDSSQPGNPTGMVNNGSQDFALAPGSPAFFIFVSEDGSISGWNPNVPMPGSTTAVTKVPGSAQSVLKGATIAQIGNERFLYVADFKQAKIKVYNTNFQQVWFFPFSFVDPFLLAKGFAPFNVRNIGGNLYVAFAKRVEGSNDEAHGAGLGFVDVFSPHGFFLGRLEHGDWFNAPWGLALAPSDFGSVSHKLLVGQFGSGEILIFHPVTGRFEGKLHDQNDNVITIEGLWALSFGSGALGGADNSIPSGSGSANTLYFTAGINDEADGLFGTLTPAPGVLTQGDGQ